jgi:radical SAM protein with 4Fe4S-binding SPASM domain
MERVVVPPRLRSFEKDGWFLYFDPHNFNWVRLNDSGRFLMERFRRYRTIEQVSEEVAETFGLEVAAAEEKIREFVAGLVEQEFLHMDVYRERHRDTPQELDFALDIYLHLTNACNLKCPYCYNKTDRDYKIKMEKQGLFAPILTTEEYKHLISRVIDCGVKHILFTGGEPLMRQDVFELLEYTRAKSSEVVLEMLTNAILIKEDVAEKLCDYIDAVTISLDGHERHLHEHFRGRNTFAPTIRGIRTLVEVRNRRKQTKPYIATVPALTDKNIGFMKEIFEFSLDGLGVDGLAPIIFQAGDHQALTLNQIPTIDAWSKAQERTRDYMQERAERMALPAAKSRPVIPRRDCGVGRGEFSVDPSGYVYPCQSLHFNEFICGNVRKTDIKEIYDNAAGMRQVRSTKVDRIAVCRHCDLKELCNGGCRATAYNVYRKFDAHNEIYCRHLEKIAVGKMWGASDMPLHTNESACV